jgi:hypothetical protein
MIAGFQVTLNSEGSIYGIAQDHPVFLIFCTRIANYTNAHESLFGTVSAERYCLLSYHVSGNGYR